MERTFTISTKGLLVTAVALLAVALAYVLGGTAPPAPTASAEETGVSERSHTIRMLGAGTTSAVADQVAFTLSVTDKQPDLTTAMDGASRTMNRVLARLATYGVKKADVQTTGLSMRPEYDYPSSGPAILTGYRVTQTARVVVTDIKGAGAAISGAVETGGNGVRVRAISLQVGDREAVIRRARDQAVADATAKARQYADATGQGLGSVVSIRELSSPTQRPVRDLAWGKVPYAMSADRAAMPIRAGKDDFRVRVQIVWELAG